MSRHMVSGDQFSSLARQLAARGIANGFDGLVAVEEGATEEGQRLTLHSCSLTDLRVLHTFQPGKLGPLWDDYCQVHYPTLPLMGGFAGAYRWVARLRVRQHHVTVTQPLLCVRALLPHTVVGQYSPLGHAGDLEDAADRLGLPSVGDLFAERGRVILPVRRGIHKAHRFVSIDAPEFGDLRERVEALAN